VQTLKDTSVHKLNFIAFILSETARIILWVRGKSTIFSIFMIKTGRFFKNYYISIYVYFSQRSSTRILITQRYLYDPSPPLWKEEVTSNVKAVFYRIYSFDTVVVTRFGSQDKISDEAFNLFHLSLQANGALQDDTQESRCYSASWTKMEVKSLL